MTITKTLMTLLLSITIILGGCASTGSSDPRDPIEEFNRAMFKFNEGIDNALFKPIAKGYRTAVPPPINQGVSNFFGNINDVVSAVNGLLQAKFKQGGSDIARVLINSTLGIFGLFDFATDMGFEKHDEDFGQTMGKWGIGNGPYLVLPILGPSTVRDTAGFVVDANAFDPIYQADHIPTRNSLLVTEAIDTRAGLLGASNVLEKAALDRYEFLKESYLQRRDAEIHGNEFGFPE